MIVPEYFQQEHRSTCSLAVLRMVLNTYGIKVSEKDLVNSIKKDYGGNFKNIWNPTIAKLACGFGIQTRMYALWPLFKKDIFPKALKEYVLNPNQIDIKKFENPHDKTKLSEPILLAYNEMFEAVKEGCTVIYGRLTPNRIRQFLQKGFLIQTSVKLNKLYPGEKISYHSILLFGLDQDKIIYHDPSYRGAFQEVFLKRLQESMDDVGAAIVYRI